MTCIAKEFSCNFASNLVAKLPPRSKRFGLDTVCNYYQDILGQLPSKFKFSNVTEDLVPQLLKDMNIGKAAVIDNLSGKILKDGGKILAKPTSERCNLSINIYFFQQIVRLQNLKFFYRLMSFISK